MQEVVVFQTGVKDSGSIVSGWLWTGHLPPFLLRVPSTQNLLEFRSRTSLPAASLFDRALVISLGFPVTTPNSDEQAQLLLLSKQ